MVLCDIPRISSPQARLRCVDKGLSSKSEVYLFPICLWRNGKSPLLRPGLQALYSAGGSPSAATDHLYTDHLYSPRLPTGLPALCSALHPHICTRCTAHSGTASTPCPWPRLSLRLDPRPKVLAWSACSWRPSPCKVPACCKTSWTRLGSSPANTSCSMFQTDDP